MKRVMIVEDEAFVAFDLEQSLTILGYEVVGVAGSGEDAISQIKTTNPDLILMDIMLTDEVDGIEVGIRIRNFNQSPIVFLTAYSDPATIERMKQVEPFGYIRKPYDDEILRVTLELAFSKFEAEKARILSERRLMTTLKSIGDGVITTDAEGRVDFFNEVASQLTGWQAEDAIGKPFAEIFNIINERTREPVINPIHRVLNEGITLGLANNTIVIARDGTETPIDDSAAPIISDEGEVMGMVIVFRDISARRESERMIRQAQRLDSLGVLAGGFAHDFNNILTAIMTQSSILLAKFEEGSWEAERVSKLVDSAEKAAALTNQLLNYAGRGYTEKTPIDLNQFLKENKEFFSTLQTPESPSSNIFHQPPLLS